MTVASTGRDMVRPPDPETQSQAVVMANHPECALSRQSLPSRSVAKEEADAASSVVSRKVRLRYGLLQAAIEDAIETAECSNVQIADELEDLHARAIRSIQESALATMDLFEALSATQTPAQFASRQLESPRRSRETVNDRLVEFFESARNIVSIRADPLNQRSQALSRAKSAERGAPDTADSILSRLNTLTGRQKTVLVLVAEGLPNKVIAHRLGISETTVKAHVIAQAPAGSGSPASVMRMAWSAPMVRRRAVSMTERMSA